MLEAVSSTSLDGVMRLPGGPSDVASAAFRLNSCRGVTSIGSKSAHPTRRMVAHGPIRWIRRDGFSMEEPMKRCMPLALPFAIFAHTPVAAADVTASVDVTVEAAPEVTTADPEEVLATTEPPDPVYEERMDVPGRAMLGLGGTGFGPGRTGLGIPGGCWRSPRAACTSSRTTSGSDRTWSTCAAIGVLRMRIRPPRNPGRRSNSRRSRRHGSELPHATLSASGDQGYETSP